MTAFNEHALADARHEERYSAVRIPARGTHSRHRSATFGPARRRLGVLLVEAGLHLMARSEPAPRVSSPLAR
jgi:hypothetical protein